MYLGEISFRGVHHNAAHSALVNKSLFETANRVLNEREEDYAKRRSSPAEYLLTGLVVCARSGRNTSELLATVGEADTATTYANRAIDLGFMAVKATIFLRTSLSTSCPRR